MSHVDESEAEIKSIRMLFWAKTMVDQIDRNKIAIKINRKNQKITVCDKNFLALRS